MSQTESYRTHPAAEIFPAMDQDQYGELLDSIRLHGLLEKIVLCDGKVLDGRHRLRACLEAGVETRFTKFQGDSPAEFVWSKNFARRHLTTGQRAAAAFAFKELLAKEARHRMSVGGRMTIRKRQGVADLPQAAQADYEGETKLDDSEKGRTRDKLAKMAGVSPRTIQNATKIAKESPELLQEIKDGRSVNSAMAELKGRKEECGAAEGNGTPVGEEAARDGAAEGRRKCREACEKLIETEPVLTSAIGVITDAEFMPEHTAQLNKAVDRLLDALLPLAAGLASRGAASVEQTLLMLLPDAAAAVGLEVREAPAESRMAG